MKENITIFIWVTLLMLVPILIHFYISGLFNETDAQEIERKCEKIGADFDFNNLKPDEEIITVNVTDNTFKICLRKKEVE